MLTLRLAPTEQKLDALKGPGSCVQCRYYTPAGEELLSFRDALRSANLRRTARGQSEQPTCTRYVNEVTGEPRSVWSTRGSLGECKPEGLGFEPKAE